MMPMTRSSPPDLHLFGKTALVTESSCGISCALALALSQAGAQVLVHFSSFEPEACAVVAKIREAGGRAEKIRADLSSPDGAHALADRVRRIVGGRLDLLVTNAGSAQATNLDAGAAAFDKFIATNIRAPFFLVQQLLPVMCQGSSVLLVSNLRERAETNPANAMAKGALDALSKQLAPTLGVKGIRVNALVVSKGAQASQPTLSGPTGSIDPGDISSATVFLLSEAARSMSAATILVDTEIAGPAS